MSGAVTKRSAIVYSILLLTLLAVLSIPFSTANVVVFDQYDTTATITGNTISIERDVRIQNVGQTPIIPGEVHFRLYQQRGDTRSPIVVQNLEAYSEASGELTTRVLERGGETDMSVHLWNPLLPGFYYDFTMSYEMEFSPSGILFYEIRLPREDTTIPIVNERTEFLLDDKYSVTYAPQSEIGSHITGNTVVAWNQDSTERVVEYSRIPLPKIGVRAVNVFWILVILLLVAVFILSLRKGKNNTKSSPSPATQQNNGWQQPQQHPPRSGTQQPNTSFQHQHSSHNQQYDRR